MCGLSPLEWDWKMFGVSAPKKWLHLEDVALYKHSPRFKVELDF